MHQVEIQFQISCTPLFDWPHMAERAANTLTTIATCLDQASSVSGLPIATLGDARITASLLTELLSYLPSTPTTITLPFSSWCGDSPHDQIVLCIPPNQVTLSADEDQSCLAMCESLHITPPRLTHWLYAAMALCHAGAHGKALVLMPQTSLSRSAWRMGQQDFIDNRLIEAVVALPEAISAVTDELQQPQPHRSQTTSYDALVVLSHPENRKFDNRIAFVLPGETELLAGEHRRPKPAEFLTPYEQVVRNGYLLTPFRYREERPAISHGVRLRDVARITRGVPKARLREIRQLASTSPGGLEPAPDGCAPIAYLTSKDFEHGYDYCHLSLTGARPSSAFFAAQDLKVANIASYDDECILLSRTGSPFKACRLGQRALLHEAGAYLVADNVYRIKPGPELDADYLLAFFVSDPGQQALSRIATSSTSMQQISPNDLRDMLIPLPPKKRQLDIAVRYREQLDRVADMERQRRSLAAERDSWFQ